MAKGFVPVLHGDVVLNTEETERCLVLSGDEIARELASALQPQAVVFISDVAGVFSAPPPTPGSKLLPTVTVHNGKVRAFLPDAAGREASDEVILHTAAHDVTGGMAAKIVAAHAIKLCLKGDSQEVIITGVPQFASCSAKESEALSFPALIEDEEHTKVILFPE